VKVPPFSCDALGAVAPVAGATTPETTAGVAAARPPPTSIREAGENDSRGLLAFRAPVAEQRDRRGFDRGVAGVLPCLYRSSCPIKVLDRARREGSMLELTESIVVQRSRADVWAYVTTLANWPQWWGGTPTAVEPGWSAGAKIEWEVGRPSTLTRVEEGKVLAFDGGWTESEFRFQERGPRTTAIEWTEHFTKAQPRSTEGWRHDAREQLAKLKAGVEAQAASSDAPSRPGARWWQFWK
jgi:hypothetical protein